MHGCHCWIPSSQASNSDSDSGSKASFLFDTESESDCFRLPSSLTVCVRTWFGWQVELPLTAVIKDLLEIFRLVNGTSDFCTAKTTVSGRLFGQTGQAIKDPVTGVDYPSQFQTRFFKVVTLPRSGVVVIDQTQVLTANGFTGNSEIEMLADCATGRFDFNAKMKFGIHASSKYQGPSKLEVEEWIEVFPSTSYAGAYIFRVRQKLNLMCTMNATHLNYYDKYPDNTLFGFEQLGVGHIVPRQAYNASGACDDCWCSDPQTCDAPPVGSYQDEEGICTPCHELSQERIDAIQEDPFEFVFFQQVGRGPLHVHTWYMSFLYPEACFTFGRRARDGPWSRRPY